MGDYIAAQAYAHQAQPVMAVPVGPSHPQTTTTMSRSLSNDPAQAIEDNFLTNDLGSESLFMDETIERSGNLFSQLDSMIAAVQIESNAFDSMREKLKELDASRNQLTTLTKRLLEADQANLTLKGNLIKLQEAYSELRRSKAEVESTVVPIRQELQRTKEQYNKERNARLAAQQETTQIKEHLLRLERINEDLERECKLIPGITESNEILKNDLSQLRQRYKEDKSSMMMQIRSLEGQLRDVDNLRNDVKNYALRLLDLSTGNGGGGAGGPGNQGSAMNGVGGSATKASYQHHTMGGGGGGGGGQLKYSQSESAFPNNRYEALEGPPSVDSMSSKQSVSSYKYTFSTNDATDDEGMDRGHQRQGFNGDSSSLYDGHFSPGGGGDDSMGGGDMHRTLEDHMRKGSDVHVIKKQQGQMQQQDQQMHYHHHQQQQQQHQQHHQQHMYNQQYQHQHQHQHHNQHQDGRRGGGNGQQQYHGQGGHQYANTGNDSGDDGSSRPGLILPRINN